MKKLGYILITVGFILASLTTVTDHLEVNWTYFGLTLAISVAGIFMVRSSDKAESMHEDTLAMNMKNMEQALERILNDVKEIRSSVNQEHPQATHKHIDDKLPQHLEVFIDARKSIGHIHGLQAYANIMNYFATGERYLNRVWSASVDGYIDEVTEYMGKSEEQFKGALEELKRLDQMKMSN